MKKYIPVTILLAILIAVICFYQFKVNKLEEKMKESELAHNRSIQATGIEAAMWRLRYLLLCDAVKQKDSKPELLEAIKKNSGFTCGIDEIGSFDKTLLKMSSSSTDVWIIRYDLSNFIGLNDKIFDKQVKTFIVPEFVSIEKAEGTNDYVFTISPEGFKNKNK